jgi:nicotinate phosphoribosyltransferase
VLEFGLRRGHERGANAGGRAALIGGANFTSNVGLSHILGFLPKGTHAHSMVQAYMALGEGELGAFRAYAELYPDDCLLLVDTINTLESGIPNAIRVFEELRRKGHQPVGIRLDSGDLAYLTVQAARMLNQAGFPDTTIVLSNDLDELIIWQILTQITAEAPRYGLDADEVIGRLVFGVGTRLITSAGESALGGVYKLVALHHDGEWQPAIKISETAEKTPNPGYKHVWRLYDQHRQATADLIGLDGEDPTTLKRIELRHPTDHTQYRFLAQEQLSAVEPLLVDVWREGKETAARPSIETLRERRAADVDRLHPGVRRIMNPHIYHVSLTRQLWDLKDSLIQTIKLGD